MKTNRRRAFSLIECLVMISLVGVTLGAVSITLHGLKLADRRLRAGLDEERNLNRFIEQWRDDVHSASLATIPANEVGGDLPTRLHLTWNQGRVVEYGLDEQGIVRVVRDGGEVQQRDSYALGLAGTTKWNVDTNRDLPLVSLELPFDASRTTRALPDRVVATVGLGQLNRQHEK